jgi:hypothetical protein
MGVVACTPPLPCQATASPTNPRQYTTVTITVQTAANASVRTVAHYKTKDTVKTATANASGVGRTYYSIGPATPGYRVVVDVRVTKNGREGNCSTAFTPRA